DQQGVALVVAQPDAADVARLRVELGTQVETAEDQPLVGGVELGDPLRGLEDHGVTFDQPALVTQAATTVTFGRQLLGGHGRLLQLDVDAVDKGLLRGDFARDELFGQLGFSHSRKGFGKWASLPPPQRWIDRCGRGWAWCASRGMAQSARRYRRSAWRVTMSAPSVMSRSSVWVQGGITALPWMATPRPPDELGKFAISL